MSFSKLLSKFIYLSMIIPFMLSAQMGYNGGGHFHPDSLQDISVSGTAIVDSSMMMHAVYYLDEDGDGTAEYQLNFGPYWYRPDSSDAVRPQNGDQITIKGGAAPNDYSALQSVVVYEINGNFWRNPTEATWNMMGGHDGDGGHHTGMGYAFGWMHDSVRTQELSGIVLTDTTFIYTVFYLDTDSDSLPDFYLNFGPPWYQPESGAEKPQAGDDVTLIGGEMGMHDLPMLIVYELNGEIWRDADDFGMHFGGGWIDGDMTDGRYFHSPFDSLDGMYVRPGWRGGMGSRHEHDGGMMADSIFCQILEVFPQSIPNQQDMDILAGYEIGMFNPDGNNNMWMDGMNGGHMTMRSNVDYTLHYSDIQLEGEQIKESSIEVKYWDDYNDRWVTVNDAVLDEANNTVTFSSDEVSNFVVLSGQHSVTALDNEKVNIAEDFVLKQNYPNPFNPVTVIEYQIAQDSDVKLTVYNALGQKVAVLVNAKMGSGSHRVEFNAASLPSGTYYYKLQAGNRSSVNKMLLIK